MVKKNVYDKLVAKVNNIDTTGFVLKTKYDTDKSELEKKIPDTSGIWAESSRIQKLKKRYNGFTSQQNLLSHKWLKNTTDFDHKLWTCSYGYTFNLRDIAKLS